MNSEHIRYLRRALALARRGGRRVRPNPLVGALVVKNGHVVGRGWHEACGAPHAEVNALRAAGAEAKGARLYVTLEPCNHHGRTGPCTEAILAAGVRELFYCSRDPNSEVQGGGASRLSAAGLEVRGGILEMEEQELNASWYHWLQAKRPLVTGLVGAALNGISEIPEEKLMPLLRFRGRYDAELREDGLFILDSREDTWSSDPKLLLEQLGAKNIQSLLVTSPSRLEKFFAAGLLTRLVSVHLPSLSARPVIFRPTRLELLRVRAREALSVYRVLS